MRSKKKKRQNPVPCTSASIFKSILSFVQYQAPWSCFLRAPTPAIQALFWLLYSLYEKKEFIVRNSAEKSGRLRLLCSISCLELGLAWNRTRGSYMILQIIFGLTRGSLSIWLSRQQMIVKVLLTYEDAIIAHDLPPTATESTLFASMVHQKYPLNGWSETHFAMSWKWNTAERFLQWEDSWPLSDKLFFSPDYAPGVLHDSSNNGHLDLFIWLNWNCLQCNG